MWLGPELLTRILLRDWIHFKFCGLVEVIASLKAKLEALRTKRKEEAKARLEKLKEHEQKHADQTSEIEELKKQLERLKEERQQRTQFFWNIYLDPS